MKIRHKLMILLLAISVIPILAMVLLLRLSVHRLSRQITQDIQSVQLQDTIEQLTVNLHNYRESITSASAALMLAVKLQTLEVENRLGQTPATPAAVQADATFGLDEQLEDLSAKYEALHRCYPNPVDFRRQGVILAANLPLDKARTEITCLQTMTAVYHNLYQAHRGHTLWHYTALENGLFTLYPAGGKLPLAQGYDPRERPWYKAAQAHPPGGAVSLTIDAVTQTLVLTVSRPVHHPDGSFAGVTAIDLRMDQVFAGLSLPSALSDKVQVLLATLEPPTENTANVLRAIMQAGTGSQQISWQTRPELPVLSSSDQTSYQTMIADLQAGRPGTQIMDYQGEKTIWVYSGRIGEKASLHMLIPYSAVQVLAEQTRQRLFEENRKQVKTMGLVLLGIVALALTAALIRADRFTKPIRQLATMAGQLSQGDFQARASIKTGDELEQLAAVMNDVGPKLQLHEKAQRGLELAGAIQKNLLPQTPPVLSHFEIAGGCWYCDETGGDYFDFIPLSGGRQGRVAIVLGDVSGHGIGAALLMASARGLLRNAALSLDDNLSGMMQAFNDQLSEDTPDDKFLTMFYGILSDEDRSLRWASGGHDPALWYHRQQAAFEELPNTGPLMGFAKGMTFDQAGPVTLAPGDILLIGTDGIWEAQNTQKQFYGKDRLRTLLAQTAGQSARQIAAAIVASVQAFTAPHTPADDVTLIVVKAL